MRLLSVAPRVVGSRRGGTLRHFLPAFLVAAAAGWVPGTPSPTPWVPDADEGAVGEVGKGLPAAHSGVGHAPPPSEAGPGQEAAAASPEAPTWGDRAVAFLAHIAVAPLLLTLGFFGLVAEIKTPGFGAAGAAGLLALALFFASHVLVGLAEPASLLLFGAGMVLLGLEIYVFPGFGLLGVAGFTTLTAGLILSLLGADPTGAEVARAAVVLGVTVSAVVSSVWALLRNVPYGGPEAGRWLFLLVGPGNEAAAVVQSAHAGPAGALGVAATDLDPSGVGLFEGERVDVVAESLWIREGTPIRVLSSEGMRHVVQAAESAGTEDDGGSGADPGG